MILSRHRNLAKDRVSNCVSVIKIWTKNVLFAQNNNNKKYIHQSDQNRIEQQHVVEQLTRIFSVKMTDLSDSWSFLLRNI